MKTKRLFTVGDENRRTTIKMKKLLIAFAIALILCGCGGPRYQFSPTFEYTVTRTNGDKVTVQGTFIDTTYDNFSIVSHNNIVFSVPDTSVTNVEIKPLDLGSGKDGLN